MQVYEKAVFFGKPITGSFPGELIFWQAAAGVVDGNFMGEMFAPFPQNKVLVRLAGSRREARDEDARCAGIYEPLSDPPRSRLPPLRNFKEPSAGHIIQRDASGLATIFGSQIDDIFAIDVV